MADSELPQATPHPGGPDPKHLEHALHEKRESLWWIAVSPTIWALHFLASYITVAIWCARFAPRDGSLGSARTAIVAYTVVALLGITLTGMSGLRRHRYGDEATPHDFDTPEDRHRFLGFSTLLLSGLSLVAVLYVAGAAAYIGSCR